MDPRKIPRDELEHRRAQVASSYGIELWGKHYTEQQAAWLLLPPDQRPKGLADTSTLKRNRRAGRVPYVAFGNGSIRFWGVQLVDYLLFGEKAVLLWGGSDELPNAAE